MRRYVILALTALVVLWAAGAYAEVQNVKVSGKVEVKGVYRDGYVVQGVKPDNAGYDDKVADEKGAGDYFITTAELKVAADLTDNVSATVVMRDEREFGGSGHPYSSDEDEDEDDVRDSDGVDSLSVAAAYVDLKEFLYAPLSVRAGFWTYKLGSKLILGDGTPNSDLVYSDLSKKKSFDGILATYSLEGGSVLENASLSVGYFKPRGIDDDREGDIYVVDSNFDLDRAAVELYYVYDGTGVDVDPSSNNESDYNNDDARNYIGGRVSGSIMEGLTGAVEGAYLFGDYGQKDYDAWALDASLSYTVDANNNAVVGAGVIYRSGDKDIDNYGNGTNKGDYEAWYAPYEDQVIGEIADYDSNVLAVKLSGSVNVIEDVTLAADYYHFWADEDVKYGNVAKDDDLGDELDVYLTWDYTSDVQFGLTVAAFWPGDCYEKDDTALEVLGSMTVNF